MRGERCGYHGTHHDHRVGRAGFGRDGECERAVSGQDDQRAEAPALPIVAEETPRGFTDHEHLDDFTLVHMNARVYDPKLGRFLSPDPFIQFPESTQGLNRYTYTLNNPLSFTDPTGHFLSESFAEGLEGSIGGGDGLIHPLI